MMLNLCFHGVGVCRTERESGEARYWVPEGEFLRILDVVADRADVRLSFDDGNLSDREIALPALVDRGLRADIFVLAGRLEDPTSLDAPSLRTLRAAGMSIGSHGWSHTPWRGLGRDEVRREFYDARERLAEAAGADIRDAAFPLGRYDRHSLKALRAAGYRTVFTSDRFRARPSSWMQARYSITATDTATSVKALLDRSPGLQEARNVGASIVKRWR
ncbi:polysaccharide deacetylase family protein [Microbacterium aurum]|uniref:polysaccharide deacetylase family protein n=1 Tax=Microbacterium aurum TaxID=36805 RepID=UPI0028E60CCE|nr:polysaccharide deacetylase family protein [Microbacterium aurum]